MPLLEKGIQRASKAVVVEFVGRHIPEQVEAGVVDPVGNIDERRRMAQACRQQNAQHRAMRVFQLRIGRHMTVDDALHIHAFEQWQENGERSEMPQFVVGDTTKPGRTHGSLVLQGHPAKAKRALRDPPLLHDRLTAIAPKSAAGSKASYKTKIWVTLTESEIDRNLAVGVTH